MSKSKEQRSSNTGCIGDIAEVNPKTKIEVLENEHVSFISMQDTDESGGIIRKQVRYFAKVKKGYTRFAEDDVLVAKITPCFENGKGGYAQGLLHGVGFGSTEFHVIRALPTRADSKYLYHLTRSSKFRRFGEASMTGSAGQKRISAEFIREYPIFIPPLHEQKKIAEILSGIDKMISLLLLKNLKLEALKKAVSADLLSENLDISEIPAGWKLGCIGDIAKVVSGFAFSSKDFHDNQQEGIPVIRMSDIQQGCLNLGGAKRVSNYSSQVLKKFQVQHGDLLFGMSGSIEKSVLVKTKEQALLNQRVGALRSLDDCNNFHAYAFQSEGVIDQILELAAGGAQLNISAKQVESIALKIPPLPEQKKIAKILSGIDKRISTLRLEKIKLETLKKAVSADLLSGRKRVTIQS